MDNGLTGEGIELKSPGNVLAHTHAINSSLPRLATLLFYLEFIVARFRAKEDYWRE